MVDNDFLNKLISRVEAELSSSSTKAIAPIERIEKGVRDGLVAHFRKITRYDVREEIFIDPQAINMPTKYTVYITKI